LSRGKSDWEEKVVTMSSEKINFPEFSVLMSVYQKDKPEWLELSLGSIINQRVPPAEVVLVKDGPLTNELDRVISQYCNKGTFKIISLTKNMGLSAALSIGLTACSHSFIARMDADDISRVDRFQKQLEYIQKTNADVVGSWANAIDDDGNIKYVLKVPTENSRIHQLIWTCPFIHPSVMYRKIAITGVGGYQPESGPRQDDYDLWFRCSAQNLKFFNIPEPLLFYRFSSQNIMRNNIKVGWYRLIVGLKGCRKVKANMIGYLGVTIPFIRSILPSPLNYYFYKFSQKFNPRSK
jgi:glycosyltransferase involved in cell wall biosynthesis